MIFGTKEHPPVSTQNIPNFLRKYSKFLCASTLFLIFVGGLVKSTESGLAVPDWPLSYGTLFPPMVGGVFYEHGHRMVASFVGFLTLCFAIVLGIYEKRRWVKVLGYTALAAVILQGLLGGLTVLFFLPAPISVAHGLLAQTFFVLTIILAYSQSNERAKRPAIRQLSRQDRGLLKFTIFFFILIYLQLLFGAVMRHLEAGLAIPDFPTMAGRWWPSFDQSMLNWINMWRFEANLDPINIDQVAIHLIHRLTALTIFITVGFLIVQGLRLHGPNVLIRKTFFYLGILIATQITLGILTVLSQKGVSMTTFHVMVGAAVLGWITLLILRLAPLRWKDL